MDYNNFLENILNNLHCEGWIGIFNELIWITQIW